MLPSRASNITLFGKEFESLIYCFKENGDLNWSKRIGYSKSSIAPSFFVKDKYIYAGDGDKNESIVRLYKLGQNGDVIWESRIDSLENIDAIYADDEYVSALVSFFYSKEVNSRGGGKMFLPVRVYQVIKLKASSGKIISKKYHEMGVYLSEHHFANPEMIGHDNYYLNNTDTLAYLKVHEPRNAIFVGTKFGLNNTILAYASSRTAYSMVVLNKKTQQYRLCRDRYYENKTDSVVIPEAADRVKNVMMHINSEDVYVGFLERSFFSVYRLDSTGSLTRLVLTDEFKGSVISFCRLDDKVVFLEVSGRSRAGNPGKLRVGNLRIKQ